MDSAPSPSPALRLTADADRHVVRATRSRFGHSMRLRLRSSAEARTIAGHIHTSMQAYSSHAVVLGPFIDEGHVRAMLELIGDVHEDQVPVLRFTTDRRLHTYLSDNRRRALRRLSNLLERDGRVVGYETWDRWDADVVAQIRGIRHTRLTAHTASPTAEDGDVWETWLEDLLIAEGARVETMRIDGRIAAYAITGARDASVLVYEGFHDPSESRYGPGRLLEARIVQRALDSAHCSEVDWMTSTSPESLLAYNGHYRTVTATRAPARVADASHTVAPRERQRELASLC